MKRFFTKLNFTMTPSFTLINTFYKKLAVSSMIFCSLLLFTQSLNACNNSSFSINSLTPNPDGTITYNITFTVELGGGDGSYYGFVFQFLPPAGGPIPTVIGGAGSYPATLSGNGGLSGTLTAEIGNDVNSTAVDSDWNKYDNTTNVLSYESFSSAAFNDFTFTIDVIVSGVVENVFFDAHVNFDSDLCRYTSTLPVLPIELANFAGQSKNEAVLLSWQTATEINNRGFEIQRSYDSETWETINFVDGEGDSSELVDYEYEDNRPLQGENYYRLKQIDFDGKFSYSDVILVKMMQKGNLIAVFPNPVHQDLTVAIAVSEAANGNIQIFDYSGKVIFSQAASLDEGTNQLSVATDDLQTGIYFLQVAYGNELTKMIKFVKR